MVLLLLHLIHLQQLRITGYKKSFLGAITMLFVLQANKKTCILGIYSYNTQEVCVLNLSSLCPH